MVSVTLGQALEHLSRTRGGSPLVTHYAPGGDRTELSVTSFANWVDKTANLLDELGLDADADVALPVLDERPGHWMALIWPFALWARGAAARVLPRAAASGADMAVIGPDDPQPVAAVTLACSLHPWALPLTGLPDGVVDFASAAIAQPDAHLRLPSNPDDLAWADPMRELTFADVDAVAVSSARIAATPTDAWDGVALIVAAIRGGGSVVLIEPSAGLDVAAIAAAEKADVR